MRIRLGVAFVAAMCLCTVLLAGCAGGTDDADQGDETVKIGVIVSETGTYAALGESERDAIELEVERINEAGGIDGRMIEAIIEDDATDEAQAVSAASKLIEQDGVVAIVGATGTGQSMAFRSEIQRAGIPQVSMAGGSVITAEFDSQVFQTPWPNRLVVPFILDVMADEGLTRVGLISDSGGYGKDGRSVILDTADAAGIEIVADETYNAGDSDMTAQLTKINSQDPDAILMWTAGSGAVTIAKNKAQLGIDLPIFGGPGIARMEFNEGAGEDAEDVILAAGKILLPETYGEGSDAFEVATAFIDRYEESY